LNFEVTVIDDRAEFANKERFPGADHVIVDEIGKSVQDFPISPDTYLVIVTRGHRCDADALRECINSDVAYIGMIGSRRKIKLMRKEFLDQGWATPDQFDRVYAPIGTDIQSKTVEEIAISIAAQLVLVRSQIQNKG
jgi:xanthine dehydrogenase accessory factor